MTTYFSHSFFMCPQKASIFPRHLGLCGREVKCSMPSRLSVFWNSVTPCQLLYCRPLSVRISSGLPYVAIAMWKTSSTSFPDCPAYIPHPTRYREWSSTNPIR